MSNANKTHLVRHTSTIALPMCGARFALTGLIAVEWADRAQVDCEPCQAKIAERLAREAAWTARAVARAGGPEVWAGLSKAERRPHYEATR